MEFHVDKHRQLRIQASTDLRAEEPDTLILSVEQTEQLFTLLRKHLAPLENPTRKAGYGQS